MSVWILIITVLSGNKMGLDHVEFSTQSACESAKSAYVEQYENHTMTFNVWVMCVPKNDMDLNQ